MKNKKLKLIALAGIVGVTALMLTGCGTNDVKTYDKEQISVNITEMTNQNTQVASSVNKVEGTNETKVTGNVMCNPILQAKILNDEKTDLNVIIGLCVGHDSLFYKYSDALCTTLVTKDKVLAHNPAGALYQSNTYYKKLFND